MKAKYIFVQVVTLGCFFLVVHSALAQGTSFTYQGQLIEGGGPANGSYDFQFTLYNAATNGDSVASTVTAPATCVTNGLFVATLDFGGGVFGGQPLWLEIGVRTNGGESSFATLCPRQQITSAPYAVTAANLSGVLPVSQLSGTIPVASIAGAQSANINLATNLNYTNYDLAGQALLAVTIGHTYIYYPTEVQGTYDGSYLLGVVGTNWTDSNWLSVDPGGVGFAPPFQTNQVFVATQGTVTFFSSIAASGPVTDELFDLANMTLNGTVNGIGQFNGTVNGTGQFNGNLSGVFSGTITNGSFSGTITNSTFSGVITNSALAGNAQGGAVTNLDAAIANLRDYGQNISVAFQSVSNSGGVLYDPGLISTGLSLSYTANNGSPAAWDSAVHLVGNGPSLSQLGFSGTAPNTNFFDSSAAPFAFGGIDFSGVKLLNLASLPGTGNNNGYISSAGGFGTLYWQNDEIDQFNIGACTAQSGIEMDAFSASFNGIGLILPTISDGAIIHDIRSIGNTNAGMEIDSRGNQIYYSGAGENIGILVGRGGADFIQTSSEGATNCVLAFGYPADWPYTSIQNDYTQQYAGSQNGNSVPIGPVMTGFGYVYPGPQSSDPFASSAYIKVWNPPSALDVESITLSVLPAYVSYVALGDSVPVTFHHVTVGMTNLAIFSDGTSIPSCDGTNVGLNEPDLEFTKNVLTYSRDTNGDLFAAGSITAAGALSAATAQVGALNIAGATPNSLLGTDAGDNVTGISIGTGLTLSGGTLSASPGGSSPPPGNIINTYTSNHTATAQDGTILINGYGVVVTLPDASAIGAGTRYDIKLIANSSATIITTDSQHIDGSNLYTLSSQYKHVTVQSDGSQWWILASN